MKHKISLFLILGIIILSGSKNLFAQKSKIEVIKFNDSSIKKNRSKNVRNEIIIKTNPLSFLSSWQIIEVEKTFSPLFSLQAGIGLTFGAKIISINNYFKRDYDQNKLKRSDYRNSKLGPVFTISSKFYYQEEAPDGAYIGFALTYANRYTEAQKVIENATQIIRIPDQYTDENKSTITITARYGSQYLYTTLTTDFFIGLGIEISSGENQEILTNGSIFRNNNTNFKTSYIHLELGARVGFQL